MQTVAEDMHDMRALPTDMLEHSWDAAEQHGTADAGRSSTWLNVQCGDNCSGWDLQMGGVQGFSLA